MATKAVQAPVVEVAPPHEIEAQLQALDDLIRQRAYALFEERGRAIGNDMNDWLEAESDILRNMPVQVKEHEDVIDVHVEVADFQAKEIHVGAAPRRIIVIAKSPHGRAMRAQIDLPEEVVPDEASARLDDGELRITVPKLK